MKKELICGLTGTFAVHAQESEGGVEFLLARDLQHLSGYLEWRNFRQVVNKAKTACEVVEHAIGDHFVDVSKMVKPGSGGRLTVDENRNFSWVG